ncbi:MAG: hypothetical protein O2960_03640 [Verrucomicrobia bacterium]|nr:hypothetical protein [Verrucomicrobiota bacterium]
MPDPDVALLLEEVKIDSAATKPHYAVVLAAAKIPVVVNDLRNTCNISVLSYGPDYSYLEKELQSLLEEVNAERSKTVMSTV